jgi:hypothetical protein
MGFPARLLAMLVAAELLDSHRVAELRVPASVKQP